MTDTRLTETVAPAFTQTPHVGVHTQGRKDGNNGVLWLCMATQVIENRQDTYRYVDLHEEQVVEVDL